MTDLAELRQKFRKCSPEALGAILTFRETLDPGLAPAIVEGIVRRYLPSLDPAALHQDGSTVTEAWGVDSLTLMEILLDLEDVFDIDLSDANLRELRTVGELRTVLQDKIAERRTQKGLTPQ